MSPPSAQATPVVLVSAPLEQSRPTCNSQTLVILICADMVRAMTQSPRFICVGSVLWDIIASASVKMNDGSDVPGLIRRRPGGVALNIAIELERLGGHVRLMSAVGKDADGDALITALPQLDCSLIHRSHDPTDSYMALENPDGSIFGAIADCASLERAGDKVVDGLKLHCKTANALILDGNLPVPVLRNIFEQKLTHGVKTALAPASPGKAERLRDLYRDTGAILYVNKVEAEHISNTQLKGAAQAAECLYEQGAFSAVVTDGANPSAQACAAGVFEVVPPKVDAKSTTGAGDVFLAAHLTAELAGNAPQNALEIAATAACTHITKDPS